VNGDWLRRQLIVACASHRVVAAAIRQDDLAKRVSESFTTRTSRRVGRLADYRGKARRAGNQICGIRARAVRRSRDRSSGRTS